MQPQDQTSMAGPYLSSPNSSSGGRYHNVITLFVYGRCLSSALKKKSQYLVLAKFLNKKILFLKKNNFYLIIF